MKLITDITKASETEDGLLKIEGLASVSSVDRDGDSILPSAWDLGSFLKNPILLSQHNHNDPIGKITDVAIVDNGLYIKALVSKSAAKTRTLIEEGIVKSFSVGFRLLDGDWKEDTDFFTITKADLTEISVVSIPANPDAVFSVSKSADDTTEYDSFKKSFKKQGVSIDTSAPIKQIIKQETPKMTTEVKDTGAERLLADVAKRLADMEAKEAAAVAAAEQADVADKAAMLKAAQDAQSDISKAYEDLKGELAEKASEIKALNDSKMAFVDKGAAAAVSKTDTDSAIFLAKMLGRKVEDTSFGKALMEKAAAGPHLSPNTMDSGWETEYNTRVMQDIKNLLVIEPLFGSLNMVTPTQFLPINPEAGTAQFIGAAAYGSTDGSSTGTAAVHALKEQTLIAHKLASKEYVSMEEDEDSIISLMPIIRSAVVRRMANASDIALLRGQATGDADPIAGLTKIAATDTNVLAAGDQLGIGAGDKLTISTLSKLRRKMGQWGLSPSDVVYVVGTEGYFDLLDDPDFKTVDLVGQANATILNGQIGSVLGSPVIVSTSFEAPAIGKVAAVAMNKANFLVGNFRSLKSERDYVTEDQRTVLVSTRRFGFMQTIAGNAVATVAYKA